MAYNNGFPVNYGFQIPQPMQPAMPQQNSQKIWVQGEAGAKSYLVAPNTTVDLWDSEQMSIYIKSADSSGMPSMKILDYKIRDNSTLPQKTPLNDKEVEYVTKEELEAFKADIFKNIEDIKEGMGA